MSNKPEISFDIPLTRAECVHLINLLHGDEKYWDGLLSEISRNKAKSPAIYTAETRCRQHGDDAKALRTKLEQYCFGYSYD